VEGDCDPAKLTSNEFEMEWPPRSGKWRRFPEIDRGQWFSPVQASEKLLVGQRPIVEAFFERQPVPMARAENRAAPG
jgi:predicted NUDIX family NTP pyrophosphohydrolase